jgi:hypothetical protein
MLLDVMLALPLVLAAQRVQPPADPRDCRPRPHLLRSAPAPPVFSIGRFREGERVTLSVHRCPGDTDWRLDRHVEGGGADTWLLASTCGRLGRWIEAAERLPIPPPLLAPFPATPRGATWYRLASHSLDGAYRAEVTLVETAVGSSNAVVAWAREGEALFAQCPAQGGEP